MRILLVQLSCTRPEYNEPIAITCLEAALRSKLGSDAEIVQCWDKVDPNALTTLVGEHWDLIGFSMEIGSLERFQYWYEACRELNPPPLIVVGNVIPTHSYVALMERFPGIACCIGEGEETIVAMAEARRAYSSLGASELPPTIPNLAYANADGEVVLTDRRAVELTDYPSLTRPFLHLLRPLGGIARLEASRGCHWGKCEFCSVSTRFGEGVWRDFPEAWLIDELETLSNAGIVSPYFSDEDFFGQRYEHSISVAKAVIAAKEESIIDRDMNFFISVLAADLKNPQGLEAIRWWHRAGLREVFLGVEAGDNEQLRRYGKKARALTNETAVTNAIDEGLQVDIGFIMFEPSVTLETLERNIEFLGSLPLDECDSRVVKNLRIQPMTAMFERYSNVISGPLDIDQQEYPYDFLDDRVGEVWNAYDEFEREIHAEIDEVLASVRGEVASEAIRRDGKRLLAKCRDIDLKILCELVVGAMSSSGHSSHVGKLLDERRAVVSLAKEYA